MSSALGPMSLIGSTSFGGYLQKLLLPGGGRCGWRKLEARAEDRVGGLRTQMGRKGSRSARNVKGAPGREQKRFVKEVNE